jgi:uncharacterized damage-inducible protein DinB
MDDPGNRTDPPETGDERATLVGFLNWQRQTTEWKCRGLSADELRVRPIPSTNISLLGLVRHLADVEAGWTRGGIEGIRPHDVFSTPENRNADFDDVATADVDEAFRKWRQECAHTDGVIAGKALDDVFTNKHGHEFSIRWLLCHLVEEYARHNGHADLIREAIDGSTGE